MCYNIGPAEEADKADRPANLRRNAGHHELKHRHSFLALFILALAALALAACDSTSPAPSTATPAPAAQATTTQSTQAQGNTPTIEVADTELAAPVDNAATPAPTAYAPHNVTDSAAVASPTPEQAEPSPTAVTATSSGADMTALQALAVLKQKALAWRADARLGLLANTRPGQQKNLLGNALGDPDINEPTPGGKGRNWTLVAFSPSAGGAIAISMDGTQVDLAGAGAVSDDVLSRFAGPEMQALSLSKLDISKMADSDKIAAQAGARGQDAYVNLALLSPDGLGLGPLPTPQAGGPAPQVAYELVSGGSHQSFIFYDAISGSVVLDSSAP